jgi:hypothetical protein
LGALARTLRLIKELLDGPQKVQEMSPEDKSFPKSLAPGSSARRRWFPTLGGGGLGFPFQPSLRNLSGI